MLSNFAQMISAGCILALCACTGSDELLSVGVFHLRDASVKQGQNETLADAERNYYLRGYVTKADREAQKGLYYTIRWNVEAGRGPVTLRFRYQQARTASQILVKEEVRDEAAGSTKIIINGDDYSKNGRILAWQLQLFQDGQLISEKRSYLWE